MQGLASKLFKIPLITKSQILGFIRYCNPQSFRGASPQITNPQMFMINPKIANPQVSTKYCLTLSRVINVVFIKQNLWTNMN